MILIQVADEDIYYTDTQTPSMGQWQNQLNGELTTNLQSNKRGQH